MIKWHSSGRKADLWHAQDRTQKKGSPKEISVLRCCCRGIWLKTAGFQVFRNPTAFLSFRKKTSHCATPMKKDTIFRRSCPLEVDESQIASPCQSGQQFRCLCKTARLIQGVSRMPKVNVRILILWAERDVFDGDFLNILKIIESSLSGHEWLKIELWGDHGLEATAEARSLRLHPAVAGHQIQMDCCLATRKTKIQHKKHSHPRLFYLLATKYYQLKWQVGVIFFARARWTHSFETFEFVPHESISEFCIRNNLYNIHYISIMTYRLVGRLFFSWRFGLPTPACIRSRQATSHFHAAHSQFNDHVRKPGGRSRNRSGRYTKKKGIKVNT